MSLKIFCTDDVTQEEYGRILNNLAMAPLPAMGVMAIPAERMASIASVWLMDSKPAIHDSGTQLSVFSYRRDGQPNG